MLSQNDRELSKGTIIPDFVSPSFRVQQAQDAGVHDGVPRFYGAGGERISLTISDDVGIDMSSISVLQGADIAFVTREGTGAGVVLTLPAVIEDPVVLEVSDVAGNRAKFRFEIVTRDPGSRPDSQPDSGWATLDGRRPRIFPLLGTFFLVPAQRFADRLVLHQRTRNHRQGVAGAVAEVQVTPRTLLIAALSPRLRPKPRAGPSPRSRVALRLAVLLKKLDSGDPDAVTEAADALTPSKNWGLQAFVWVAACTRQT